VADEQSERGYLPKGSSHISTSKYCCQLLSAGHFRGRSLHVGIPMLNAIHLHQWKGSFRGPSMEPPEKSQGLILAHGYKDEAWCSVEVRRQDNREPYRHILCSLVQQNTTPLRSHHKTRCQLPYNPLSSRAQPSAIKQLEAEATNR